MSIQSLQTAFAAASWPVTLNAEFISNGGAVPPENFDTLLKTAFVLGDAVGLVIGQGSVSPVSGDSFTITGASLVSGLFGATTADTVVTLTFTLPVTAGAVLLVQIDTALGESWTFASGFPAMVGNPFNQLSFSQSSMVFASADSTISWPTATGPTVTLSPGMNFAGIFVPSAYAQSVLAIANLSGAAIPSPLVMSGPFDASTVSATVIFPVMDLVAPLLANSFTFLGFTASQPYFGFSVGAMPDGDQGEQTVSSIFGATLTTATSPALALDFSVLITGGNSYSLLLAPPEDDATPLTPANIATIAGVNQNFIAAVPAPLQSFFTSIAFQGINLCAMLPSGQSIPTISSIGVSVGTVESFSYVLIADPTCSVTLTSLDLNWTILNPTGNAVQLLLFTTTFTLLPNVFTDINGNPDGEFRLTINQDFTISALFDGQVSLANLLPAVTARLVQLPSGISVIFSNVYLLIDTSTKTYAFSLDVDAEVDIITWNSQPLIQLQGMTLSLSASSPQTTGAQTTYEASITGLMVVGPVGLNVDISYDGAANPTQWNLTTSLSAPLDLGSLLSQLFAVTDLNEFLPDFLPQTLTVNSFAVTAVIPGSTAQSSFTVAATLDWTTTVLLGLPIACSADLALAYDGSLAAGKQFSGSVLGTIEVDAISGLELMIGYAFNQPDAQGGNILTVQWEGVTGTYNSSDQTITLTLNGWSFGSLVSSLVAMTGNPYFSLTGPWAFLNSISLDGLALTFNLASGANTTVSASYNLPSSISLGFITIEALNFSRDPKTGKVLLSISGSSPLQTDQNWQSLFDPTQGQDITQLPEVPGQGNALFDLRLLALGQHVSFNTNGMDSVAEVITALENIPSTTSGGGNPVNPYSIQSNTPCYDAQSNWLVAANFGLLGVKSDDAYIYTVDVEVVFNDPGLYGLRLSFNGEKAMVLDGLVIDIMYKKVSVSIGVYQLDFTFPNSLRQLNFGAINVTLPSISIQIYTNGDFLFDLGFPYNLDFSRSFTLQGFVGPFPVMGSGGFYFGKLSAATATGLPITTIGTFDPVIEFGLGLQLGLGYSIDKGILSAGFSVTFLGIIQGVIAPWHPYDGVSTVTDVQSSNYFCLTGQFGIQGKLFGTVNFAIISASVSVTLQLVVQIVYQAYRAIPISISASVSVAVGLKIDLGLFSFQISFSFATTISEDMTIGQDQTAPWEGASMQADNALRLGISLPRRLSRRAGRMEHLLRNRSVLLSFSPLLLASDAILPTLTIVLTPQYTVLCPDVGNLALSAQQGAFVALFSMDAPTADGTGNASSSSFASLCSFLLPWVIASHPSTPPADRGLQAMDSEPIQVETLQEILNALADPAAQPTLSTADILTFLQTSFLVNIVTVPDSNQQAALQAGAMIFPALPGLTLTVPDPEDSTATVTIDLANWTQATPNYRTAVITAFNQVAANINNEINPPDTSPQVIQGGDSPESLTQILFEDCFAMISRQLLQTAIDAYDSYPYALQPGDSLQGIMDFAQINGNANPVFTFVDLVSANTQAPLSAGVQLTFPGIVCTVQTSDCLNAIAARYTDNATPPLYSTTPAALIMENSCVTNLLQPGVTLSVGSGTITTQAGDSFKSIAQALGITVNVLSEQASLYPLTNLLLPGIALAIPPIVYQTAAGDTLGSLLAKFNTTADSFVGSPDNLAIPNIFNTADGALVHLSNLELLTGNQLSQAIAAGETIGQTAGMVSRFMLQGLRLPNASGLSLPSAFLYPQTDQPDYGLYQLTGQQFPVTDYTTANYQITLAKDQTTLARLEINGDAATGSGIADLTKARGNLKGVLNWAVSSGYDPNAPTIDPPLTLAIEPSVVLAPMQFAAAGYTSWFTSGMAGIETITGGTDAGAVQPQPYLWQLPPALLSQIEMQQAALEQDMLLADALPYLPVFSVATLTSDPATRLSTLETVPQFSFATRIDFQIRQLSQAGGAQTQTANSNTLLAYDGGNTPPVTELAPNCYQLIGPSPSDAQLLQRILTQIDALGINCVTGLLLGYANPSGGLNGLVGHSSGDVYSFITRSNLSTQGNPPASTMALLQHLGVSDVSSPVNDAANDIDDFIRMLWELSTVQSGGYTFYWDGLVNGADLPSGLFDSSGYATLTLLVTYARSADLAPGTHFTDCCNAVLTASAIDTSRSSVVLVSQSSPNSATVLASDSIASLAARYSMTTGTFAAANPGASLSVGSSFMLNALYHQISLADMLTSDVWATIAAYYSVNAASPLTAERLQAYNPGVDAASGVLILIPETQYIVAVGDTLSSIAAYFSLRVDVVGASAQGVVGLFVAGQSINVDSQSFSVVPALGTGNVGMELVRANLEPSKNTDPDYGKNYLFSLYSLLDMAVCKNAFFSEGHPSSPFGPSTPNMQSTGLQSSTQHIARLRHPASRRAYLAAQAESPLSYSQALSIYVGNGPNAAPANPAPYLPAADVNPYIGVGAIVQLGLRWLDIFGNLTSTPFNNPQPDYSGPLNNPPAPVLYTDRLIGLSQWPNVSASYLYSGETGSAQLQITLTLNIAAYQPNGTTPAPAATTDATVFNSIYFQVNQNYDELGIPGLSGPAVTFSLANTLTGGSVQALDADNTTQLIAFINACTATVNAAALGVAPSQQSTVLTLAVPLASVVADNVVRLRLTLLQNRLPSLVDASLLDVPGGVSVSSEIPAFTVTGGDVTADALLQFAQQMEVAFLTQDWQYRVGTGPGDPDAAQSDKTYSVWAVRFASNGSNQGMAFTLGDAPVFFAPKPVANCLYTGSVVLPVYQTGTGLSYPSTPSTTYTGVDLNLWFAQALGMIDNFLAATYAAPTFILDAMQGDNPDESGMLFQILSLKSTLADTIASTVSTVFADDAPNTTITAAAMAALKQSLLLQLSNATTVTAIAVVPVSDATTNEALPEGNVSPPAFYGQPVNSATTQGTVQNYALSSGIVPLNAQGADSNSSSLAFLFTCANPNLQTSIPLELTYQLTQLQTAITAIDGIEGYRQSTWINFVTGPISCPIGNNPIDFPVVLRALPLPPTAQAQSGAASNTVNPTPAQLCDWDYSFTFDSNHTAQDSLRATVAFNTQAVMSSAADQTTNLFEALAAIIVCAPSIFNDFNLYLRKIDPNSQSTSSVFLNAQCAVQAWVSLITTFSKAYAQWAQPSTYFASSAVQSGPPQVVLDFQVELTPDNEGDAVIQVITLDWPNAPIPQILIGNYEPEIVSPTPSGVLVAYRYPQAKGDYLTYGQALKITTQTVRFTQLNAVLTQSADTAIEIQRNLDLVDGKSTNGDFVFSTAPVSFGTPMVPLLANVEFDLAKLDPPPATPAPLVTYLSEFFGQLLGDQGYQWVTAQIQASANYPINQLPGSPIISIPISLLPPATPNSDAINAIATSVAQWLDANQSEIKGIGATLNFNILLYGTLQGAMTALVKIENVYISIDKIC